MARRASSSMTISAEQRRWRAEDDLRTLQRAREIEQDKKRHAEAQAHAKRQMDALKSIHGKKG